MKSPLKNLLGARTAALKNRLEHHGPAWWAAVGGGFFAVAAVLVVLGHFAAPSMVIPPIDIATPRGLLPEDLPAGTAAMEAAFWLTALIATVLNFRVMELLFRRKDIRAVEYYALPLPTLFVDRLLAALAEAVAAALFCTLFFVPLLWHGTPLAALLCAALLMTGLITTTALAFGVLLVSGASQAGPTSGAQASKGQRRSGDMYGGAGQVFLYAPGVALGFSVVAILFLKLVLGEILRTEAFTRPALYGLTILVGFAAFALFLAYRDFTRSFPAMAARFREADIVGFDVDLPYQKSAFVRPTRLEPILDGSARYLLRAHILQYGRRYMMARYLYVLSWLGGAWALWSLSPAAFPAWIVAVLPAVLLAFLANPWRRTAMYHREAIHALAMPVSRHEDLSSQSLFTARETLLLAAPYAVAVLAIRGGLQDLIVEASLAAAVAIFGGLAMNAALGWSMRAFGSRAVLDLIVPLAITLAIAALAAISLVAVLPVVFVLAMTHLILWKKPYDLHTAA
ncbi:MAG: hypothetical protein ACNA8W_22005 [Bradymonadaceae bacterium]